MAINDVECCDFYQVHENVVKAVNDKMPDEDKLYDLAEIFRCLGIPPGSKYYMCSLRLRCVSATLRSCLI